MEDPLKQAQAEYLRAQTKKLEEESREKANRGTMNIVMTVVFAGAGVCVIVFCLAVIYAAANQPR